PETRLAVAIEEVKTSLHFSRAPRQTTSGQHSGMTIQASQLRSEIYKETDFAARQIWESIPNSSIERPPWKQTVAGPYTPGRGAKMAPTVIAVILPLVPVAADVAAITALLADR